MNKSTQLLLKLLEKTKRGDIQWNETEIEGTFQAAFPAYSVRISSEAEPGKALSDYFLKIYNQEGKQIEEISQYTVADDLNSSYEAGQKLQELYEMARRIAMHVEEALDNLLLELEKKEDNEPPKK